MRQKRILDVAEDNPDATIKELASNVPSASTELVERVLNDHGDPADDEQMSSQTEDGKDSPDQPVENGDTQGNDTTFKGTKTESDTDQEDTDKSDSSESAVEEKGMDPETSLSLADLSEKQQNVLEAVAARPEATQQEIGDILDVSSATVSNRVKNIPGFDWKERKSQVDTLMEASPSLGASLGDTDVDESQVDREIERIYKDVSTLENKLEQIDNRISNLEPSEESTAIDNTILDDPNLVYKVVHACMESENISKDEELQILKSLLS
ncbi:MAG: winged helix-turn-helix transcriptional regulator [Halobacteriaceae archaeon]